MTRPPPQQKNRSVVSANLCFLSLLAVVGCSTETDKTANHFQYSQTELLLKDGNVIDTRQYWRDGNTKIIDSPFRTLPPKKDELGGLYAVLDAGCKFASFFSDTTTHAPSNKLATKGQTRVTSDASLSFNPNSESVGSFDSLDFVFNCSPSTRYWPSVDCEVEPKKPELMSQIPYHNRARDRIVDQLGTFQSFVYVKTVSKIVPVEGKDNLEFTQSIRTISLDRERMTCKSEFSKNAP